MTDIRQLTRVEQLIIWMRRHKTSFSKISKEIGLTRMSVCRLCKAERISRLRHYELTSLGIPAELLPPAIDVKRGRKPKSSRSSYASFW